jgi:hypothetical protein
VGYKIILERINLIALPDWTLPLVRVQIQTLCEHLQTLCGEELEGIYLHGSLAMNCFNVERSDLDLLVVNKRQMSVDRKYQITDLLLRLSNAPCPIEISFLIFADIHPFEHPLPFDFHYSEMWRQQKSNEMADGTWMHWNEERRRDPDLTAHLVIAHHRGITLYGKPISVIFPAVPNKDYVLSILEDYHDAREGRMGNPVYFVLNACRIQAFLVYGYIFSKDEGGVYGLETFPTLFHPLIQQALEIYRGRQPTMPFEESMLDSFAAFMDQSFTDLSVKSKNSCRADERI